MDPRNYRPIMIGHILAKLYGSMLEAEFSALAKRERVFVHLDKPGCDETFPHLITSSPSRRSLSKLNRAVDDYIVALWTSRKAFDIVPRDRVLVFGVCSMMIWGSLHYMRVSRGDSDALENYTRTSLAPLVLSRDAHYL